MAYKITYYTDNGDYTIKGFKRTVVRTDVRTIKNLNNFIDDITHECKRLGMFACITHPNGAETWCNVG